MSILEASVERQSCAYAKAMGGLTVKIQSQRGWPDRLVIRPNGSMFLVEFKRPGGKPTIMQAFILGQLTRRNVEAYCISSVSRFKEIYERV